MKVAIFSVIVFFGGLAVFLASDEDAYKKSYKDAELVQHKLDSLDSVITRFEDENAAIQKQVAYDSSRVYVRFKGKNGWSAWRKK